VIRINSVIEETGDIAELLPLYVNLDDSAIGIAEKAEILLGLGIKMIKEFDPMMLYGMIEEGVARNTTIVIDTVKKIVNLMDKQAVADMMKHFKNFTHAGGTVILLAHANKHPGADGRPILEGVADLRSDADCVVVVERHKDVITMTNDDKHRSYVELEAIFQTAETKDYKELMDSIKQLSGQEAEELKLKREQESYADQNRRLIDTISEMLGPLPVLKTDLVRRLIDETGLTRKAIIDTLDLLEDELWEVEKGPNNSKNYTLKDQNTGNEDLDDHEDVKGYLIQEGYIPHDDELLAARTC
jgi:hypothetical protein